MEMLSQVITNLRKIHYQTNELS